MSERNLRMCGRAQGCRDPRNDFELDVRFAQSLDLFSSPPEDQRVAALDPNHLQAEQRIPNHQLVDSLLTDALASAALANAVQERGGRNEGKNFRSDKIVIQHDVGGLQKF